MRANSWFDLTANSAAHRFGLAHMLGRVSTTLVLVRHGETRLNRLGVMQGRLDEPLNEVGLAQVEEVACGLAAYQPAALYSSALVRARQTAEAVSCRTGLEVRFDPRLAEIDCGSWEGRTVKEVVAEFPQLLEYRRSGRDFRRSDTGETAGEVATRVCEALNDIIAAHENETVVIASHGLAIRVGIARLLGLPDEKALALGTLGNCQHAVVNCSENRVRLTGYNLPGAS